MSYNLVNQAGVTIPPALRGFLLGTYNVITNTASSTFTPNKFAKFLWFQLVGGGGAGRNATNSSAGQIIAGGGGGGGSYTELIYPALPLGFTVQAGAGGSGAGGTGGSSSTVALKVGSNAPAGAYQITLATAVGGALGAGALATGNTPSINNPTNIAFGTSLTFLACPSRLGGCAFRVDGTNCMSGKGGDSMFGGGAKSIVAHGNGIAGGKYGGGGSGAMSVNAAGGTTGGDGGQGVIIIWEFY